MIPTRSQYAGQSYRLFADYNDIHVFVEDVGFENLYLEIVNRCGLRVKQVFSRAGKASVIEAARHCDDHKCVYIVDRDWDDLLGTLPSLTNLVVLKKHSIENYLLDYSGFRGLVLASHPRGDIESILGHGRFDEIVNAVSHSLRPLFECFLAMQIAHDPRPNCSLKPGSFQQKNRSCAPDPAAISSFVSNIGIRVSKRVRKYFAGDVMRDRGHGKYMLHFVWASIRHESKTEQLGQDSLLIRLAQAADPRVFAPLCRHISRTATTSSQRCKSSVRGKPRR